MHDIEPKFLSRSPFAWNRAGVRLVPFSFIVCFNLAAMAQGFEVGQSPAVDNVKSLKPDLAFTLPGEHIDFRTGKVYFEIEDYRLRGTSGMDIVISRSFHKASNARQDIGYGWDQELPRLTSNLTNCADTTPNSPLVSGYFGTPIELLIPGEAAMTLFQTPGQGGTGLPGVTNALWASTTRWTITCTGINKNDFLVHSPTGKTYHFPTQDPAYSTVNWQYKIDKGQQVNAINYTIYYADNESDLHGNWINYSYGLVYYSGSGNIQQYGDAGWVDRNVIQKITSSDGREVDFTSTTIHDTSPQKNTRAFITSIGVVNGPNPIVTYGTTSMALNGYCPITIDAGSQQIFCLNLVPVLQSVTLADGNSWSYLYQHFFGQPYIFPYGASNTYVGDAIIQATHPNGLVVQYSFQANPNTYWTTSNDFPTFQNYSLALTQRAIGGPKTNPVSVNYSYYTPNISLRQLPNCSKSIGQNCLWWMDDPNPNVKIPYSYSFESYGSTLISRKYLRYGQESACTPNLAPTDYSDFQGELCEEATMPLSGSSSLDFYNAIQAQVPSCMQNTANCNGEVVENAYAYGAQWLIPGNGPFRTITFYSQGLGAVRPLIQRTTYRKTGVYNYNVTSRDAYEQPLTTVSTAPGTTDVLNLSYTYFTNPANFIIGLPQSKTIAGIGTVASAFDPTGLKLSENKYGLVTGYDYYSNGELHDEYHYNTLGQWIPTATYSNYKLGIAQTLTQQMGRISYKTVDNLGRVTATTDPNGHTTSVQFDVMNRPTLQTPPLGASTTFGYPDLNTTITTRGRRQKTESRDALGRPVQEIEQDLQGALLKRVINTAYDGSGRKSFVSNPGWGSADPYGMQYNYDVLDRPLSTVATATNAVSIYSYLPNDQVSVLKPNGSILRLSYENFGAPGTNWLTKSEQELTPGALASGNSSQVITTSTAFDHEGKILLVNQNGVIRTMSYNSSQLLSGQADPERAPVIYTYFPNTASLKSSQVGSNPAISYTYDNAFRMLTVTHPGNSIDDIVYTYDYNSNQLTSSTNEGVRKILAYDANNNRVSETVNIDGLAFQTAYVYDSIDQLAGINYPNESQIQGANLNQVNAVTYAPDAFGHPTYVQDLGGYLVSGANFYPNGIFNQINYGNGVTANMTLTPAQWPGEIQVNGKSPTAPPPNSVQSGLITDAYYLLYGRAPTTVELQAWEDALNNGVTINSIVSTLKESLGIVGTSSSEVQTVINNYLLDDDFLSPMQGLTGVNLRPQNSNFCVDLPNGLATNGTYIQQWTCLGAAQTNQLWNVVPNGDGTFQLLSTLTGSALLVAHGSQAAGTPIIEWTYTNINADKWRFVQTGPGEFQMVSTVSGMCMAVTGGGAANGTRLDQEPCQNGMSREQIFHFQKP